MMHAVFHSLPHTRIKKRVAGWTESVVFCGFVRLYFVLIPGSVCFTLPFYDRRTMAIGSNHRKQTDTQTDTK